MEDRVNSTIKRCFIVVLTASLVTLITVCGTLFASNVISARNIKYLQNSGTKVYAKVVDVDFYIQERTRGADREYQSIRLEYIDNNDTKLVFGCNIISTSVFIDTDMEIAVYYDSSNISNYYVDINDIK